MNTRGRLPLSLFVLAIAAFALAQTGERRTPTLHWCAGGRHASDVSIDGLPIRSDAVMFYEHTFGIYPRFYKGKEEKGGVPQNADLNGHLAKVRLDVEKLIPQRDWEGYAVVDFEGWDALWETTGQPYKDLSIKLARERHPTRPQRDIERLAKAAYESAARTYLEKTMEVCREVRPRAKWGYYGKPGRHHHGKADKLRWLGACQSALYPVCYVIFKAAPNGDATKGFAPVERYAAETRQAVEIAREVAGPSKPVIALIWVRYHDMNAVFGMQLLDSPDLDAMLREPIRYGADGLMFWDSVDTPEQAREIQGYVNTRLRAAIESAQQAWTAR